MTVATVSTARFISSEGQWDGSVASGRPRAASALRRSSGRIRSSSWSGRRANRDAKWNRCDRRSDDDAAAEAADVSWSSASSIYDLAGLHETDLLQTSGVIPDELLDRAVGATGVSLDLKIGDNGARLIV